MAKLEKESLTFGVQRNGESYSSYLDNQDKELDKLVKKSLTLPKGEIKGGVFKVQIADGYAYYLVTKVRPLTVQHIHVGDAWRIPEAHIRGVLTKLTSFSSLKVRSFFITCSKTRNRSIYKGAISLPFFFLYNISHLW